MYASIKFAIGEKCFREYEAEELLHRTRMEFSKERYLGPSFPAIAGFGANGAIIHYRPTFEAHSRSTQLTTPILIDTGGHYLDGTTDTTRTLTFSNFDKDMVKKFPELKET